MRRLLILVALATSACAGCTHRNDTTPTDPGTTTKRVPLNPATGKDRATYPPIQSPAR